MAPVVVDPKKIRTFKTADEYDAWLRRHHDTADELWIRMFKKASGRASIDWQQAVEVSLCWGWIDGIRKSHDAESFLQRYTPRRPKSVWSQINRAHVARLVASGRMTPHGLRHVDAAKADGRWEAATAPIRETTVDSIPADLRAAIEQNPNARRLFSTLNRQNLFALAYRTNNMKTPAGRAAKIEALVAMLARGETISPQPAAPGAGAAPTSDAARRRTRSPR